MAPSPSPPSGGATPLARFAGVNPHVQQAMSARPPTTEPFERGDQHGTYALNPIGWMPALRLRVLYFTLVPFKATFCVLCTLAYFLVVVAANGLLPQPLRTKASRVHRWGVCVRARVCVSVPVCV